MKSVAHVNKREEKAWLTQNIQIRTSFNQNAKKCCLKSSPVTHRLITADISGTLPEGPFKYYVTL
jgi:hypothetical protein